MSKVNISPNANTTAAPSFSYYAGTTTSAPTISTSPIVAVPRAQAQMRKIDNAVYAHVRALRSLGRITVTVAEIASSLNLSSVEVRDAIERLRARGINPLP